MRKEHKSKKGGLTAAGRAYFKRKTGANLKPPVTEKNPKGTIKGLGFKDVKTAKSSINKIKRSGRTHAHKIQAAIAMAQRAKVMKKTGPARVYRTYINSIKKS